MSGFSAMLFPQLLAQAPTLLACVVGCILALVYWPQHRRPCAFLAGGCLLYLLASLGGSFATTYLVTQAADAGGRASMATQMAALGLVWGLLRAAGLGLLIVAALIERSPRA
ncbi:MAG TPA: hypothetical protein VGC55_12510 [Dokdonella sp.]